jgi:hypothetical protein
MLAQDSLTNSILIVLGAKPETMKAVPAATI